ALTDALAGDRALRDYHLLPAVRGDLLVTLGRPEEARREFERASALTRNAAEQAFLQRRAQALPVAGPVAARTGSADPAGLSPGRAVARPRRPRSGRPPGRSRADPDQLAAADGRAAGRGDRRSPVRPALPGRSPARPGSYSRPGRRLPAHRPQPALLRAGRVPV